MKHEQKNTIGNWVESLPATVAMVRVRLGHGSSLQTVQTLAINGREYVDTQSDFAPLYVDGGLPLIDAIAEALVENGYGGTEGKKARLHAHTKSGKQVKTKSLTSDGGAPTTSKDVAMLRLVDGLMESNAEIRRVITVLSDTLSHSHERLRESQDDAITSRAEALNSQFDAMALELMVEETGEDDGTGALKESAAMVLNNVMTMFTGGESPSNGPSKDDVMEWVQNEEFVDSVMTDPEIQAAFLSAYQRTQNQKPKPDKKDT